MGYRYTAQEGVSRFDFIDLDVTYPAQKKRQATDVQYPK
jgi:hypothetical protein